jgi:hypothetical protein
MPDGTAKRMIGKTAERIVSAQAFDEDALEASVRPKRLDEYIGQKRVKKISRLPSRRRGPR